MKSRFWRVPVLALVGIVLLAGSVSAQTGVVFVKNNRMGVLDPNPSFPLDVTGTLRTKRTDGGTASIVFTKVGGAGGSQEWIFFNNGANGNFEIWDNTGLKTPFTVEKNAPAQLMRLTAAGQVKVKGVVVHADYVFEPDYELESIEEHAEYMWTNKHLPAVGAGKYDPDGTPYVELGANMSGILEELEKAHIYIAQLNQALKDSVSQNEELAGRLAELEARIED